MGQLYGESQIGIMTTLSDNKRTAASKRAVMPRDSRKTSDFIKDWEKLSRSGKHDMNVLKEAMMLLIANDAPLPAEWRDHKLKGKTEEIRECHVKGDLLLVYQIHKIAKGELIVFINVGTHSEVF